MKTARFASLVAKSGTPHLHLTWGDPSRDAELRKVAKENRLLTVHQEARGNRKDFGTVGLLAESGSQFLIFPRSLRRFVGQRIVGIEYPEEPSGETGIATPRPSHAAHRSKRKPRAAAPRPAPPTPRFIPPRTIPSAPPEPATMKEVRLEVAHVLRALKQKRYAAARAWLEDLDARLPK